MDTGFRVYLLEDSMAIRDVLVSSIESNADIRVTGCADNVEAAWGDPALVQADAIIVDLALRGGNGFQLLGRMQSDARFGAAVKIVLTNYATPTYRERARVLGANHFFDKSLEFDSVVTLLDHLAMEKSGPGDSDARA